MIWEKSLRRTKSPVPLAGNNRTLELSQAQTRLINDSIVDAADIHAKADPDLVNALRRDMRLWTDDEIRDEIEDWYWIVVLLDHDVANGGCSQAAAFNSEVYAASNIVAAERELRWRADRGLHRSQRRFGFSREYIDDLKQRWPLIEEINLLTDLRASGATLRGKCPLCPGHRNSEALCVNPETNRFRCFRCNVGGDIITWLSMRNPGRDFRGIITYLSERTGVPLPAEPSSRPARKRGRIRVT